MLYQTKVKSQEEVWSEALQDPGQAGKLLDMAGAVFLSSASSVAYLFTLSPAPWTNLHDIVFSNVHDQ